MFMTHPRSRTHATLLLAACAPFLLACPLPIARTEATSAPVTGRLVRADGTPLSDSEIAVSTEWGDVTCTKPVSRTRTNSAGVFRLEGTEKRYETTWFVPNLHRYPPHYKLCAGIGDTLRRAYTGIGSLYGAAQPDSLACVAWEWETQPRVSCTGSVHRGVVTGGHWIDPSGTGGEGFYRLFLTEEPTRVKGYQKDAPQDRPYVYVQWVEPRTARTPNAALYVVRATVSVPIDRNKFWVIHAAELWRHEGRWVASLHGLKKSFMSDATKAELVIELGTPGQIRRVSGP